MFKRIDTETWYRKNSFDFFKGFADPFFNMCANVRITKLRGLIREHNVSLTPALMYFSQKTANTIPEFRTRIVEEEIVEYDHVESTHTILQEDESFSFCYYRKADSLVDFCRKASESNKHYTELNSFDVETERYDLIYYSMIPWVSFTSFKHASSLNPKESCPRIVFGKYFEQDGETLIPVSVEGNHIVMDGIHVGKYYDRLGESLSECNIDD